MRPALKRTILTSKTTGRRYYLGRSNHRSNSRRYYVCSRSDCDGRLVKESDLFCRTHSQTKQADDDDNVDESILDDCDKSIDEETPAEVQTNTDDEEQPNESMTNENMNNSIPLSSRQQTKANREVHINEKTGKRSFRDDANRLRYLCLKPSCTNMLKRRNDQYCQKHVSKMGKKKKSNKQLRHSAPPSDEVIDRFRSPFTTTTTTTIENKTNGNHSEEYSSPQKTPELTGTNRSFRDASGKIRFLCLNPTCKSRLVRRADTFCKRHQLDTQIDDNNTSISSIHRNENQEENNIQEMDVNHNNPDIPSRQILFEPSIKKRETDLSTISANKLVLSTTTLLDYQWKDILIFLRQFLDVELSTNLNVNDFTTHLLVDDSEHSLHCTITKKIVQAAARRHIFIISTRWINESIRLNQFPSEQSFEIQSDSHTTLRLSVPNDPYLFNQSYGFAIECRQCQGSINRNELIELIHLVGGKFCDNDNKNNIDILIVLCDANEKNFSKIKEKYLHMNFNSIKYVTSDFLLKSIIKFQIQDIDKYSL